MTSTLSHNRVELFFSGGEGDLKTKMTKSHAISFPLPSSSSSAKSATTVMAMMSDSIGLILQKQGQIMESIATIADRPKSPFCIFISTLCVNDIHVVKPIPVTIEEECDGSFIASFIEAGVSSGDDTLQSAVWSLQEMIASSYRLLNSIDDSRLGPKMRREKAVLSEFLCESSQKRIASRFNEIISIDLSKFLCLICR